MYHGTGERCQDGGVAQPAEAGNGAEAVYCSSPSTEQLTLPSSAHTQM